MFVCLDVLISTHFVAECLFRGISGCVPCGLCGGAGQGRGECVTEKNGLRDDVTSEAQSGVHPGRGVCFSRGPSCRLKGGRVCVSRWIQSEPGGLLPLWTRGMESEHADPFSPSFLFFLSVLSPLLHG